MNSEHSTYLQCIGRESIPRGHWLDVNNHAAFMKNLCIVLGYRTPEDLYQISTSAIKDFGGSGFLGPFYEGSAILFVKAMFDYDFKDWLFTNAPNGYWGDIKNVRLYLEWLAGILGFKTIEDWYKLRQADLFKHSGRGLYSKYGCSVLSILKAAFPDYDWLPWLLPVTTKKYWKDEANHTKYVLWRATQLGITGPEGWYKYGADVIDVGLLSNKYHGSMIKLLKIAYPDFKFKGYKFAQAPQNFWDDRDNKKEYLADLYIHMGFTKITDWYTIMYDNFRNFHGNGILDKYGGRYIAILMDLIEYPWDPSEFAKTGFSMKACNFLNRLAVAIALNITHKLNGGEFKIPGTRFHADGYLKDYSGRQIIFEYHGCDHHGCPSCHLDMTNRTAFDKTCSLQQAYDRTVARQQELEGMGFIVIPIWECEDVPELDLKSWFESQISPFLAPLIVSAEQRAEFAAPTIKRVEHRCDICNYSAFRPSNLKRHLASAGHLKRAKRVKTRQGGDTIEIVP